MNDSISLCSLIAFHVGMNRSTKGCSVKRFEQSQILDTTLLKNGTFTFYV